MANVTEQIELSSMSWQRKALLLAWYQLGVFTELLCQYDQCLLPGVPLKLAGSQKDLDRISFDHIVWRCENGSNAPDNMRITHSICNATHQSPHVAARTKATRDKNNVPTICIKCGHQFKGAAGLKQHQNYKVECATDPDEAQARIDTIVQRNKSPEQRKRVAEATSKWHAERGTAFNGMTGVCWCGNPASRKGGLFCGREHANKRPK